MAWWEWSIIIVFWVWGQVSLDRIVEALQEMIRERNYCRVEDIRALQMRLDSIERERNRAR